MAFKLIDADALTAEQKAKHGEMVRQCEGEIAKLKAAATPVTVVALQEPKTPVVPAVPAVPWSGPKDGLTSMNPRVGVGVTSISGRAPDRSPAIVRGPARRRPPRVRRACSSRRRRGWG